MPRESAQADLYLNDKRVGIVHVQRREDSWAHGRFEPDEGFGEFAPLFGQWSLLIHADGEDRLSDAAGEELRRTEYEIDRIAAKLFFPLTSTWVRCAQVNIDGGLIEWKCY